MIHGLKNNSNTELMLNSLDKLSKTFNVFETSNGKQESTCMRNKKNRIEIQVHELRKQKLAFDDEIMIQVKTVIIVFTSPLIF